MIQAKFQFPRGFLWGCATAAHQVEGQNANDWWRWEQTPGHIFQDQKSGKACDWWSGRYLEDFDRAAEMHNNAQRFSVEWSRIEPEPGKWDEWALEKYRAMLKALHDRGMTPMVTLHHFTNPLWIADHGGWLWDETPKYFERFVRKVVTALGDLCSLWCTINEPMVYAVQGYALGYFPPGMKDRNATTHVAVNMLYGHAAAYYAIKEIQPHAQVGYAAHLVTFRAPAPQFLNNFAKRMLDNFFNGMFVYAIRDGVARAPGMRAVQMPKIKGTLDWIGLQYYQLYDACIDLRQPLSFFMVQRKPTDMVCGPVGWGGLVPTAIFDHIKWLWKTLEKPIYITEAGVPDPNDTIRPGYLIEMIHSAWRAVNFNYPVRGFFHWSLQDNFEWAEGFDPRFSFGLYKTNFETQERTARPSAHMYAEICAQNGLTAETVERYAPQLLPKLFPGESGKTDVKLKAVVKSQ
jgi:beta-glucosidase